MLKVSDAECRKRGEECAAESTTQEVVDEGNPAMPSSGARFLRQG